VDSEGDGEEERQEDGVASGEESGSGNSGAAAPRGRGRGGRRGGRGSRGGGRRGRGGGRASRPASPLGEQSTAVETVNLNGTNPTMPPEPARAGGLRHCNRFAGPNKLGLDAPFSASEGKREYASHSEWAPDPARANILMPNSVSPGEPQVVSHSLGSEEYSMCRMSHYCCVCLDLCASASLQTRPSRSCSSLARIV